MTKIYIRNIFMQGGANVLAQLINIFSLPLITRLFTPTDFGVLNLFYQTVSFASIFLALRADQILILPKTNLHALRVLSFISVFGSGAFCFLTIMAAAFVSNELVPTLTGEYWLFIAPLASLIVVLGISGQQYSQRSGDFTQSATSDLYNRIANSASAISFGVFGFPGYSLLIAVVVGHFAKLLVFRSIIFRRFIWSFVSAKKGFKYILDSSHFTMLMGLMFAHGASGAASVLTIGYVFARWGSESAGYFGLVLTTLSLPAGVVGSSVGQVFFQRANSLYLNGEGFYALMIRSLVVISAGLVPFVITVSVFGPDLYSFVFGASWEAAGWAARIYVFAACLSVLSMSCDRASMVVKAAWYAPAWHSLRCLTLIIVVTYTSYSNSPFLDFVFLLTLQSCFCYLIDLAAGLRFAKSSPASAR